MSRLTLPFGRSPRDERNPDAGRAAGRVVRVAVWTAAALAAVAWSAFAYRESAVAVAIDLPGAGLAAALIALGLGVVGLLASRTATRPARARVAPLVVMGFALAAAVFLAQFRYGTCDAEDVGFSNGEVRLAGTVYRPRGEGSHPAVVLVHGSGAESRREYAFYAQYLARRGIAALAYDKRGVAGSGGELYGADYGGYAGDALAGVRLLARDVRVDRDAIGLVGFSEGEWVAPIAASRSDRVAFVAVIGASGMSPSRQVATEIAMRLRTRGYGDADVRSALSLNERVFEAQRTGRADDDLRAALASARLEPWFQDAGDIPGELPRDLSSAAEDVWWRSVMDFDPLPVWAAVRVPVLLLKGAQDDRSPVDGVRWIEAALRRGGNDAIDVRIFPRADHMLLEWPLGDRVPPPAFADGFPEALVEWLRAESRRGGFPVDAPGSAVILQAP